MKEKLKQVLKDVDNSYDMALLKIPKAIRQSSWLELFSKWTRTFTLTQLSSPRLPGHIVTLLPLLSVHTSPLIMLFFFLSRV